MLVGGIDLLKAFPSQHCDVSCNSAANN